MSLVVTFFCEEDPDLCIEKTITLPSSGPFMPRVLTLANRVAHNLGELDIFRVWLSDQDGYDCHIDLFKAIPT